MVFLQIGNKRRRKNSTKAIRENKHIEKLDVSYIYVSDWDDIIKPFRVNEKLTTLVFDGLSNPLKHGEDDERMLEVVSLFKTNPRIQVSRLTTAVLILIIWIALKKIFRNINHYEN